MPKITLNNTVNLFFFNCNQHFRVALPWELLYADDLAVIAETEEELIKRLNEWKKMWRVRA